MTGAGASSVAVAKEDGFMSLPAEPTYFLPGRNITFNEISLPRALERMDIPSEVEAVDSVAGPFEGAVGATWTLSRDTHDHVRDIVFNDAGAGFTHGRAATSRWFLGINHLEGTYERELLGVIPLEYSIQFNEGTNTIQASATFGYADESPGESITPTDIVRPADRNDVPFHGATLDIDVTTVTKLQSATLSFSNIARYQTGPNPTPLDGVIAQPRTTLDAAAIFGESNHAELAYGSTGATGIETPMDSVAGALSLDVDGQSVATYTLPKLKPDTYDWADLVDGETNHTEQLSMHVNGGVSVA